MARSQHLILKQHIHKHKQTDARTPTTYRSAPIHKYTQETQKVEYIVK